MIILILLGAISLVAIGATFVGILHDGYARVPDRPGFYGQVVHDELLRRGHGATLD